MAYTCSMLRSVSASTAATVMPCPYTCHARYKRLPLYIALLTHAEQCQESGLCAGAHLPGTLTGLGCSLRNGEGCLGGDRFDHWEADAHPVCHAMLHWRVGLTGLKAHAASPTTASPAGRRSLS